MPLSSRRERSSFSKNVFLNCPFDEAYRPLLRALVFTTLDCGLVPRIASETSDSGQVRLEKIRQLIEESRYSIHDISRIEPLKRGDLPRFNMPFELGMDLGCRYYGRAALREKHSLVLERERYRYQKVLSDIAGQDIKGHEDSPRKLVSEVRDWLRVATRKKLPSGSVIWHRFNEFTSWLEISLLKTGFTVDEISALEVVELIEHARTWIRRNPAHRN